LLLLERSLRSFSGTCEDKQASAVFLFGHAPQLDDVIATALGSKKHLTALKNGMAFRGVKTALAPIGVLCGWRLLSCCGGLGSSPIIGMRRRWLDRESLSRKR